MTHKQIAETANKILSAANVTNIYRYYTILCLTLDAKFKAGLGLTPEERHEAFNVICSQIKKEYDKLDL